MMADLNNDSAWRRQRWRREFRECGLDWFVLGADEVFSKEESQICVIAATVGGTGWPLLWHL